MVAHALYNGGRAAVAHAEALAGHAGDERLAAGSAVQRHVAGDDVLLGLEVDALRRAHDDLAAGKALAHVVVAVAHQLQRQAIGDKGTKALAACTGAVHGVHIVRQVVAVFAGDLAAKDGTKGAIHVGNIQADALGSLAAQLELLHQHLHVQRVFQMEVVAVLLDEVDVTVCNGGVVQNAIQIQLCGAAARGSGLDPQQVGAAHQLVHGAHA